jgi:outer membrane protein TolC
MLNRCGRPGGFAQSVRVVLIAAAALMGAAWDRGALADTLEGALAIAYRDHPKLNSQRAATRAADEGVGIARSGHRARVTATLPAGDEALVELHRNNLNELKTTLQQTRDRFMAGEATRTDVAQVEASLAAARASFYAAQSQYITSSANYLAAIGVEPGRLAWPRDCSPCVAVPRHGARRLDRSR